MKYWIILTSPAKADINSAVNWYQLRDPETATRFLSQTRITISRIRKYPYRFSVFRGIVRRALVPRFPYSVYYSLRNELVFVLAVLHHRQSDILRLGDNNGMAERETNER